MTEIEDIELEHPDLTDIDVDVEADATDPDGPSPKNDPVED